MDKKIRVLVAKAGLAAIIAQGLHHGAVILLTYHVQQVNPTLLDSIIIPQDGTEAQ